MGTAIAVASFIVPLLVIAGIVLFVMRRENAILTAGEQQMAEQKARIARAAPAQATVVSSRVTSTFQDGSMAFVQLQLQVTPSSGVQYAAKTEWEINIGSIPLVQPGESVAVKVDMADHGRIYPDVGWASFSRAYVARSVMDDRKK